MQEITGKLVLAVMFDDGELCLADYDRARETMLRALNDYKIRQAIEEYGIKTRTLYTDVPISIKRP